MEHVQHFYRCMEIHLPIFVSSHFNAKAFERAKRRIYVVGAISIWDINLYFVAFRCLMDKFHLEFEEFSKHVPPEETRIILNEPIDFYFDETSDKVHIQKIWGEYMEARPPEIRKRYGSQPRFADDRLFPPLQAADLWAWWVRKWIADGHPEYIFDPEFGTFKKSEQNRPRLTIDISFEEDDFIPTLKRMAEEQSPGRQVIVLPPSN